MTPLSDSEIYRANRRASKKGGKRLNYSYEKNGGEDDGVYRKSKEQSWDEDYVDLDGDEESDKEDSTRGDEDVNENEWSEAILDDDENEALEDDFYWMEELENDEGDEDGYGE